MARPTRCLVTRPGHGRCGAVFAAYAIDHWTDHQENTMRKVVLYHLMSLDGVAYEDGDWLADDGPQLVAYLDRVIATQDDVLLGRGTYDYWAGYWPTSDFQPFAGFIDGTRKHVVTSSVPAQEWANCTLVTTPAHDYVTALKQGSGGDIGVHGSIELAAHCCGPGSSTNSGWSSHHRWSARAGGCSRATTSSRGRCSKSDGARTARCSWTTAADKSSTAHHDPGDRCDTPGQPPGAGLAVAFSPSAWGAWPGTGSAGSPGGVTFPA